MTGGQVISGAGLNMVHRALGKGPEANLGLRTGMGPGPMDPLIFQQKC